MRAVCLKMVKNIQKPAERRLHNRSTSYAHNVGSAAFDGKDGDSGCLEEGTAVLRGEEARGRGAELQPDLTIARLTDYPGMTVSPEILNLFSDGFRKAGLPEQ